VVSVEQLCAPALSNGIWMRAIGLPVWEGLRRVIIFSFLSARIFARAHRSQFLRYRD